LQHRGLVWDDVTHLLFRLQQLYRKKLGMTTNAAQLTDNLAKNRYRDISPCEYRSVWIPN